MQPYSVDFVNDLQNNESVVSAVVTLSVFSGTDPNPQSHIVGTYAINGTSIVTQVVGGLLPNVVYIFNIVATTSLNYTVDLYALIPCAAVYD